MTAIGFSYDPGFLLVFVDTLTTKTVLGWPPMSASDERAPSSAVQVVKLLQDYRNSYRRERVWISPLDDFTHILIEVARINYTDAMKGCERTGMWVKSSTSRITRDEVSISHLLVSDLHN